MVVIAEDDIPMLGWMVNTALKAMSCWIESVGLSLVAMKVEVMLFTHHCWFNPHSFRLKGGGDIVLYSPELFEVVVQQNTNFQGVYQVHSNQSWKDCCEHGRRKLLVNVAMSGLLHRAPNWADAINAKKYQRTEVVLEQ